MSSSRGDHKADETDVLKLVVDYLNKHNPKAKGSMKDYFQWALERIKDEPYPKSGQLLAYFLSLNKAMISYLNDLGRFVSAAMSSSTDELIRFLSEQMPGEWSMKPMTFDVVATKDQITTQNVVELLTHGDEILFRNCFIQVIKHAVDRNFLLANMLLDLLEQEDGLKNVANHVFKGRNFSDDIERREAFKERGIQLVARGLFSKTAVSKGDKKDEKSLSGAPQGPKAS